MVVEATNGTWLINKVGNRIDRSELPQPPSSTTSKLVFIGFQIEPLKHQLEVELLELSQEKAVKSQ
jgi:hypothetical protein